MSPVTAMIQTEPRTTWQPSVATARRGAERAERAAAVAKDWSERAGVGQAEAQEVARAAGRARYAAERAAEATDLEQMLGFARLAEAAARGALEADGRVSAAIAASLWAAEDERLQNSFKPAA